MFKQFIMFTILISLMALPVGSQALSCNLYVEQQANIHLNGNGDFARTLENEHRHRMAAKIFDEIEFKFQLDVVDAEICLAAGVQSSTCRLYPNSYLCINDRNSDLQTESVLAQK